MRAALALVAALACATPALAQMDAGWEPRREAHLQALDKVTARVTILKATVGRPLAFGTLRITVRACNARPPEEVPDAAAWLEVADTRNDASGRPVFQGWMFANAPGIAMLEHPVYDLRVLECR
ncbi:MAG: cellulase-like protein [Roseomonas sp.]|nr:cellulase-like protein [Roseomonas sp.]